MVLAERMLGMSKLSSGVLSLFTLVGGLTGMYLGAVCLMDRDFLKALAVPAAALVFFVASLLLLQKILRHLDGKLDIFEEYKAVWDAVQSRRIRRSKEA